MDLTKTGTTIVGLKYKGGVVLCADTRSTSGPVVANKNCEKIHHIAKRIKCCGAGTAADTDRVTLMASKTLLRFEQRYMRDPYVTHAARLITDYLHDYQGQIMAALVLGGVDQNGVHLYSIHPQGYSASLPFTALGSGSLAAIAELEANYKEGMDRDEAVALGVSAIRKGILNDLYSGSNVDLCVIDENGAEMFRNYLVVESRRNPMEIVYPPESLEVVSEKVHEFTRSPYI